MTDVPASSLLLGLRTVIYSAPDVAAAKQAMTALLGAEPYFDTDFYVGWSVAGYELALDPHADLAAGATTYWGVADINTAVAELSSRGASLATPVEEVGDGICTATGCMAGVAAVLGLIENPHFSAASVDSSGPGS